MIIYLYGPDSYQRNQKTQFYINEFRKKHTESFSIKHIDLTEEAGLIELENFTKDQSLFGKGFKLAIIHNILDTDLKTLKAIIKPVIEEKTVTLIFSEDKKLKKNLQEFFKKHAFYNEEFELPIGAEFSKFLKAEAKRRGLSISEKEAGFLSTNFSGDSWGLANQLDKMSLGGKAEKENLVPNLFPLMFILTDQSPLPKKLTALAWLLEREEPAKIFNIAATTRNPLVKKQMARYDVLVKSGKLDYAEALLDLALK